ncbi:rap guanine nucleotide exchange factor 1 [Clonorchis sinensis]|uniref:Rap guanine nucleotide exchange factor 1 n=1 Tax=Clonorchis sinensis TaxID=79923 RepID=G7YVE3_CLOSI|nr:rap guanine nucleotide exchange factor 1 [Clonorchis sinensis]
MESNKPMSGGNDEAEAEIEASVAPVDRCCLVVQMPSVEEMRREVADITCQMQSVYFNGGSPSVPTRPLTRALTDRNIESSSEEDSSETDVDRRPSYRRFHTVGTPMSRSCRWSKGGRKCKLTSKANTIDRMTGIDDGVLLETESAQNKGSSILPREEQVSEEFVINGKRYRQTYRRKVVLERRTTRDVFFLPATTSDGGANEGVSRAIEYTSPAFDQAKEQYNHVGQPITEIGECRPRLDLAVIHNNSGFSDENCCITPSVVMRSTCGTSLPLKSALALEESSMENKINEERYAGIASDGLKSVSVTSNSSVEGKRGEQPRRSKSRYLVQEVADAFRKHIATNLRRSRSSVKAAAAFHDTTDVPRTIVSSLTYQLPENPSVSQESGVHTKSPPCCRILGYMYQFGVWDDKAPVLDPRLPLAVCGSSSSQRLADKCGTVIANPPEWHHAEVGPSPSITAQESLVRGRIVACLQRFTQHSLTSGKALHRSTYVQQTRLVRKRKNQKNDSNVIPVNDDQQLAGDNERDSDGTRQRVLLGPGDLDTRLEKNDVRGSTKAGAGWFPSTGEFTQCCPDRLQILQSICPAAAAATILLGRQFLSKTLTDSDYDSNDDSGDLGQSNNGARVLVTAKSWCPPALISQNLSSYLIFSNNEEEPRDNGLPFREKSSGLPHLRIRGGTLDGLIAYTLRLLGSESQASSQLDSLFPHVFRVTYSTFSTPEKVIEKLIQAYVAHSPVEPGCQTTNWAEAMCAARFLVTLAKELHPEQLSARIVLQLARFTRLLLLDGSTAHAKQHPSSVVKELSQDESLGEHSGDSSVNCVSAEHKLLADSLLDSLPLLSKGAGLRKRTTSCSKGPSPEDRNKVSDSILTERNSQRIHLKRKSTDNSEMLASKNERNFGCETLPNVHQTSFAPCSQPDSPRSLGLRERIKFFLENDAQSIATEITRIEEEMFEKIDFHEFLDIHRLERGDARTLGLCVEHFNRITRWARSLLFVVGPKVAEEDATKAKEDDLCHKGTNSITNDTATGGLMSATKEERVQDVEVHTKHSSTSSAVKPKNSKSSPSHTALRNVNESQEKTRWNMYCLPNFSTRGPEEKLLRLRKLSMLNAVFCQLCEVLKHLKILKNFSSFLALLLAVQEVPENLLSRKSKSLFSAFSTYMKPPMFSEYRRDLEAAELPCLPYLGLIFQQLIHLHVGNPIFLGEKEESGQKCPTIGQELVYGKGPLGVMESAIPTTENMINVWRCWKHYLILGYFIKRRENPQTSRHKLLKDTSVQEILNNFEDGVPDAVLDQAKEQLIHPAKTKRARHNRLTS